MMEYVVDRVLTSRQTGFFRGVPIKTYILSSSKEFDYSEILKNNYYIEKEFFMKIPQKSGLIGFIRGKNGKEFAEIVEFNGASTPGSRPPYRSITNGRKVAPRSLLPVEKKVLDIEDVYRKYVALSACSMEEAFEKSWSTWPRLPDHVLDSDGPLYGKAGAEADAELDQRF